MSSSKHKTSSRRFSHSSSSKPPPSAETPPASSFLFVINLLPVNDHVAPRYDPDGHWLPPTTRAAFNPQISGRLYRWRDGHISAVAPNYQEYQGNWWVTGDSDPVELVLYRTATTFFCNPWNQFLTVDGDASAIDIERASFPNNRWYSLSFRHDNGLSRIDIPSDYSSIASPGVGWVNQLGLASYNYQPPNYGSEVPPAPPQSEGLAGNLSVLIALIAFSCRHRELDTVFLTDRAWRRYQWRGHSRQHGRRGEGGSGKVVRIYLDPENPQGSTRDSIEALEWTGGGMLQPPS